MHTGNAGGGGQPSSGVEEGWGNPLHSHWSSPGGFDCTGASRNMVDVGPLSPLFFPRVLTFDLNACAFYVSMM